MKNAMSRMINKLFRRKSRGVEVQEAKHHERENMKKHVPADEKRRQERAEKLARRRRIRHSRMQDGILTRIRNADSKYHIDMLMVKANMFEQAGDDTKRKWAKAKAKRLAELGVEE